MCGRYRLSRRKQIVEQHFASVSGDEDWSPPFNIAPTQPIPGFMSPGRLQVNFDQGKSTFWRVIVTGGVVTTFSSFRSSDLSQSI